MEGSNACDVTKRHNESSILSCYQSLNGCNRSILANICPNDRIRISLFSATSTQMRCDAKGWNVNSLRLRRGFSFPVAHSPTYVTSARGSALMINDLNTRLWSIHYSAIYIICCIQSITCIGMQSQCNYMLSDKLDKLDERSYLSHNCWMR